jgi:hypothetical protein
MELLSAQQPGGGDSLGLGQGETEGQGVILRIVWGKRVWLSIQIEKITMGLGVGVGLKLSEELATDAANADE